MMEFYKINKKQYLESVNLNKGSFYPVTNFMNKLEIDSVSKYMRLPNKKIFPIPFFFDVSKEDINKFKKKKVFLIYNKKKVGDGGCQALFDFWVVVYLSMVVGVYSTLEQCEATMRTLPPPMSTGSSVHGE